MLLSLIVIGFIAGLISGISPCILPVLPVVLMTGATTPAAPQANRRSLRPVIVVLGLVASFAIFTLVGSELLSALHLPQDLLRDLGLGVLALLGLALIIAPLWDLLERPFARLRPAQPTGNASALVLGLGLGVVFVPCAGPVLAAITVIGATHMIGWSAVLLTVAFALGVGVPLLLVALAGSSIVERTQALRQRALWLRRAGGAVLITMSLLIAFNVTSGLQRAVPGYTDSLQNSVEGTVSAREQLSALSGETGGSLARCIPGTAVLESCGKAPSFTGLSAWLNTAQNKPIALTSLRGQVVLVDFWTYSCINCQRSLPHVEAWYARYHRDGLEVIGIHTPEFAFEHVESNVRLAAAQLGVRYPIALDDNYSTWVAYQNNYWPAEYLIDAQGYVRHVAFGEGGYSQDETLIRELLSKARPGIALPPRTDIADKTPTEATTPETYLGAHYNTTLAGLPIAPGSPVTYVMTPDLSLDQLALSGTWVVNDEEITAKNNAQLALRFQAKYVYLVIGGKGIVTVRFGNASPKTIAINGFARLYTLVSEPSSVSTILHLQATPGVQAYDFTFG